MTIHIGTNKVVKVIAGGNVLLPVASTWQECTIHSDFKTTPILMKYDSQTGITRFIGASSQFRWTIADGMWEGDLLTLPEGFHFTKTVANDFPLGPYTGTVNIPPKLSNVNAGTICSGRVMHVQFKQNVGISPQPMSVFLLFNILSSAYGASSTLWQTDAISPD